LVRRFKPRALRGVLAAMKVRGMSIYEVSALPHGIPTRLEEIGRRHHTGGRANLRAAVFGVNDGLVSNASLILGVAGATQDPRVIALSGIAGLLAGAFSMAAGEFVSVRSQREMYEYQIGLERDELTQYPQEEAAELALIYAAKGVPQEEAKRIAERIIADPDRALDTLSREELGLNPADLGSGWNAAVSSFAAFAAGATVPLLPFLIASGQQALVVSVAVTAFTLFAVGAAISLFTGRHAMKGGLRMLGIGAAAGAATYSIGAALGVTLG
jgi:VIT1/CCC1 family predicted Fe2+/Mn2+ transporter